MTAENFAARLAEANVVTTADFNNKLSDLYRKSVSNITKDLVIENELIKLKIFDSIYFRGKSHFEDDGTQNHLIFQPIARYMKTVNIKDINHVLSWKSKELPDEEIDSINYILNPYFDVYHMTKIRIKFNEGCLKRFPPTILHGDGGIVNIYIVYEISNNFNASNSPTLENCLFGSVKLTKHVNIDQYKYSGYGSIRFDRKGLFSIGNKIGRNVITFRENMSSSTKIDNRKKDILILSKGPTQGLGHTLSAEKLYLINFTEKNKNLCLSLHFNGANSSLFVNDTEIIKLKAKDSEILAYSLCLGKISKDWSIDNMKKTGFNGYLYDFSVDYDAILISNILDIPKYLMEKNGIVRI